MTWVLNQLSVSCGTPSPGVVGHRYTRDPQTMHAIAIALGPLELDGKALMLKVIHWP